MVDDILISLELPKENHPRFCFVVFSSKEAHREIVIDCIENVIKEKQLFDVVRLDDALKSGDSQYGELSALLNSCSFAIVVLDGFRPNVLFEYGILKGLKKPCIVLLEENAVIDIKNLMLDESIKKIENPKINMDKHFSDIKDRFYVRYNKNDPKGLRNAVNNEYLKLKNEIDNEFVKMIFPQKDSVEKELRDKLISLANLFNKTESQLAKKDERILDKINKEIESICNVNNITLPSSYFFKVAQLYEMFDRNEESLQIINKLINKDKNNISFLNVKSFILRKLKKNKEALSVIDSAIKIKSNKESLWHNKGLVLEQLNKKTAALAAYEEGVKLPHKCDTIHFHYGILLYESSKFQTALSQFEHAILRKPNNQLYRLWKAKSMYEIGQKKEALSLVKEIANSKDKNADVWFTLGQWSSENKDAIKYYKTAIKHDPKHAGAMCSLAAQLSNNGNYKEAFEVFKKINEGVCPKFEKCDTIICNTLLTMSRLDKKLITPEVISSMFAKSKVETAEIMCAKATAACNKGDFDEGIELFNKALHKYPKDTSLWYNQACAYSLSNKLRYAIRSLKSAIALESSYKDQMLKDKDFDNLRRRPEFIKAFGTQKKVV